MTEFGNLYIWAGIAAVAHFCIRWIGRELATRRRYLDTVDENRGIYRRDVPTEIGYFVPKKVLGIDGQYEWAYAQDPSRTKRHTASWWLLKALWLTLSGRKRNPEAKDLKPIP